MYKPNKDAKCYVEAPKNPVNIVQTIAEMAVEMEEDYCGPAGEEAPSYARGHYEDLSDIWIEYEEVEVDYTENGFIPDDDEGEIEVCHGYAGPNQDSKEMSIRVMVTRESSDGLTAMYRVEAC